MRYVIYQGSRKRGYYKPVYGNMNPTTEEVLAEYSLICGGIDTTGMIVKKEGK